jgi:peroxiredoxin
MAATESTMLPLGTTAPDFLLQDVSTGAQVSLNSVGEGNALLVIFLCAHCPYVLHVAPEIVRLARDYADKPLKIIGITSNDVVQYPQDAPEPTALFAKQFGLPFPILFDESQSVAHAYSAACTPDFFLFDAHLKLFYRGQMDGSRPGRGEPTGAELRAAVDALLRGQASPEQQHPSIGCNIKWKPGNEPLRSH